MPQLLPACLGPVSSYETRKYSTPSVSRVINDSPECFCNMDYKEYFNKDRYCCTVPEME
ncbi:hypothetical protein PIROE2DRAFT_21206 [Piromyces sp. E2]|nr:hypothetical protein PIROE2DRAFT_21206 [Piromyces sp. E2]|eukprot:OUM59621.1 hypothetical protein PIROE2DRAFT_21206 [Piromyces sp. E2]